MLMLHIHLFSGSLPVTSQWTVHPMLWDKHRLDFLSLHGWVGGGGVVGGTGVLEVMNRLHSSASAIRPDT